MEGHGNLKCVSKEDATLEGLRAENYVKKREINGVRTARRTEVLHHLFLIKKKMLRSAL